MRTKASTAALTLLARGRSPRRRVPRHPASGQELQKGFETSWDLSGQGTNMRTATRITSQESIGKPTRDFCRRILASTLLAACVLVAPAIGPQ